MQGARGEGKGGGGGGERAREVNVFIFPPRSSSRFFERGARHRSTWFVDRDLFSSRINYLVLSFSRYWKNLNLARLAYRAVYFHRKYLIFVATKICFSIFLIFKLARGIWIWRATKRATRLRAFFNFWCFKRRAWEKNLNLIYCFVKFDERRWKIYYSKFNLF